MLLGLSKKVLFVFVLGVFISACNSEVFTEEYKIESTGSETETKSAIEGFDKQLSFYTTDKYKLRNEGNTLFITSKTKLDLRNFNENINTKTELLLRQVISPDVFLSNPSFCEFEPKHFEQLKAYHSGMNECFFSLLSKDFHEIESLLNKNACTKQNIAIKKVQNVSTFYFLNKRNSDNLIMDYSYLIQSAMALNNEHTGELQIGVQLNQDGAEEWERLSEASIKNCIAVILDQKLQSAPVVLGKISAGYLTITGVKDELSAKKLCADLNGNSAHTKFTYVPKK